MGKTYLTPSPKVNQNGWNLAARSEQGPAYWHGTAPVALQTTPAD